MKDLDRFQLVGLFSFFLATAHGAIIGTNVPATPLTAARVAALPAWKVYFENSARQRQADQDFLRAEMNTHGQRHSLEPKEASKATGVTLKNQPSWYAGTVARQIADNLVSFQTPAGGWCKNTDFTEHRRAPGELFGAQTGPLVLGTNTSAPAREVRWNYVGTFDNDATTTELRFLAKTISATGTNNAAYRSSFQRGLDYISAAQFPNGGWPQVWPLQGGYHDAVTFNDDAVLHVIEFLRAVASGENEFSFITPEIRARAGTCWQRGLDCILAAQIVANGQHTVWCQQHDAITLQPASARNYEMPAAASCESAAIVLFLMQLPEPDAKVVAAVQAAAAWFEQTKIMGKEFKIAGSAGKKLTDSPGSGPIWARYYRIETDRPVFGDRDKSIHDEVNGISRERRGGYTWFRDDGRRVLERYATWVKSHPPQR